MQPLVYENAYKFLFQAKRMHATVDTVSLRIFHINLDWGQYTLSEKTMTLDGFLACPLHGTL